jgi:DNA-binding LacI/PurR family transcriptional regulator
MKQAPTIYDVARLSGFSISTVSRVLNTPGLVREATRQSVVDAIERLSFIPKADASARARKDFERIGVLTPYFTAPSFVERIGGIAAALDRTKYELIIYSVESLAQLEEYLTMLPVSRRLDGLIVLSLPIDARTVRDQTFTAGSPSAAAAGEDFPELAVPLTVDMEATFDSVFALIRIAEQMDRLVRVASVRMAADRTEDLEETPVLTATIGLEVIYEPPSEEDD